MVSIGGDPAKLLRDCYAAALAAVQPAAALGPLLRATGLPAEPCWVIAIGKAAPGMAAAIAEWLGRAGRTPAGGVVVGGDRDATVMTPSRHAGDDDQRAGPSLELVVGDHPIPREASARAADAIGSVVQRIPAGAEVHVAISGGASSLIAGPLAALTMIDVTTTFELLLTAGLDIHEMNAIRKRISRWSAGRLALALAGRRLHVWVISDVPGDDVASIASGPCSGDPWTTEAVQRLLGRSGLAARLRPPVIEALARETPKPGNPAFNAIHPRIVANNRAALDAAARLAREHGWTAVVMDDPLIGDAAAMGRRIAAAIRADAGSPPRVLVWGGETTVTIAGSHGTGGRSQELALAAAGELHQHRTDGILLAGGTDGRDGPTDAAGAVVDQRTWTRILETGRDPAADLTNHDAYRALDAATALLRTGPTGTNVMDLVIALTGAR